MKGDLPDGKGFYTDPQGSCYRRDFKNGKYHGIGNLHLTNGSRYQGEWEENNFKEGTVYVKYECGEVYEGAWKNGCAEGYGRLTLQHGIFYEGNWKNGYKKGAFIIKSPKGDVYELEFSNRAVHGKAKYFGGGVYSGEFKDLLREGKGCYNASDGAIYDGLWKNDLMEGQGVAILPSG